MRVRDFPAVAGMRIFFCGLNLADRAAGALPVSWRLPVSGREMMELSISSSRVTSATSLSTIPIGAAHTLDGEAAADGAADRAGAAAADRAAADAAAAAAPS